MTLLRFLGGVIVCSVLGLMLFPYVYFHGLNKETEKKMMQQWLVPVKFLANQAHQKEDDLALQEVIQSLSQVSGIRFAAIIDEQARILAHTDVTQIGQPWKSAGGLWTIPLKTSRGSWGSLVFSYKSLEQGSTLGLYGSIVLVCGVLTMGSAMAGYRVQHGQRRAAMAEAQAALAMKYRLATEGTRFSEEKEQLFLSLRFQLEKAVSLIEGDIFIFDERQKLLAWKVKQDNILMGGHWQAGASWFELPGFEKAATALARSLEQPGVPYAADLPGGPAQVTTHRDPASKTSLTIVRS